MILPIARQKFSRYLRYTRNIVAAFINSTISRAIPCSVLWNTTIRGTLCDKHGSGWYWWRYFRFLLCKPSSLISCHLAPKLRTSGPSPETWLQRTALHFSTNSSSNSYRNVRLGTTSLLPAEGSVRSLSTLQCVRTLQEDSLGQYHGPFSFGYLFGKTIHVRRLHFKFVSTFRYPQLSAGAVELLPGKVHCLSTDYSWIAWKVNNWSTVLAWGEQLWPSQIG